MPFFSSSNQKIIGKMKSRNLYSPPYIKRFFRRKKTKGENPGGGIFPEQEIFLAAKIESYIIETRDDVSTKLVGYLFNLLHL